MIKIALFGSEETIQLVKKYEMSIEGIQVNAFPYKTVHDMEVLFKQAVHCDVYLFSGILPFFHTKKFVGQFDKPALYLKDNELNISLTLLYVSQHKEVELHRISIDLPEKKYVDSVMKQLDFSINPIHIIDYSWIKEDSNIDFNSDQILQFHIDLWKEKKIDLVITSIHAVFDQLVLLNIPCMHMIDAKRTIVDALKEAKNLAILEQTQQSQIAIGRLSLIMKNEQNITKSIAMKLFSKIQKIMKLLNYTVQEEELGAYVFYGTKGGVEILMDNPNLLGDLYEHAELEQIAVHIGIGYGLTIVEAKENALIAKNYAGKCPNKHSFYVVTEDKIVLHVTDNEQHATFLKSEDESLVSLAKQLSISVTNLQKMLLFNKSRPVNSFTSSDIAEYFEITKRSAERMLKKYMDSGFLKIIGEEQPFRNGRPRAVYQLNLPPNIKI